MVQLGSPQRQIHQPRPADFIKRRRLFLPTRALALLLAGYLFFDRAFAYFHVPGTLLFIGEAALGVSALYLVRYRPRLGIGRLLPALLLVAFMVVSVSRTLPYISTYGADAIRDSALWYYGLIAFVVLAIGKEIGINGILTWYERMLPAFFLWAPASLILRELVERPYVPDSTVSIFSHRSANTSIMLVMGIVYYWLVAPATTDRARLRRAMITAGGALVVVLSGIQNRGGLIASVIGLATAGILARSPSRRRFTSIMIGTIFVFFAVFWILDIRISIFSNQREVSADQLVANLISVIQPSSDTGPSDLAETSSWRIDLWQSIFEDVTTRAPVLGLGYGINVAKLYGFQGNVEEGFRSAHNSHVSVFARSGWLGLGLWALMWWVWFYQLLLCRRRYLARGQGLEADINAMLIASAAALLTNAVFDPTIESPQVAAWVWAVFGLGLVMIANASRRFVTNRPLDSNRREYRP